ncbi:MAG: hypothetical protein JST84_08200 [Acidobacteria bacterium]|nr:hypothetical protein [Acidobacteriota bacterium]
MTELSYASTTGSRNEQATLIDPRLLSFALACDESQANEFLTALLEQAHPIVERVAGRGIASEDLRSEIMIRVIALLREFKAAPSRRPIANFSHYVSVLAANVCREEQRRQNPRRRGLKDALRHTLTQEFRLALWQNNQDQVCGLAQWSSGAAEDSERWRQLQASPQFFLEMIGGAANALKRADLLLALFRWLGHPLLFDDLVTIVAGLQGIRDDQPITATFSEDIMEDPLTRIPSAGQRPDEEAEWRAFLGSLWREIESLPPLQRVAYLLNFTDGEIEWFWFYGIASIRRIGKMLQLTTEQFSRAWVLLDWREEQRRFARSLTDYDEQFALLWQHLPLNDLTIASLLSTTRQNVINLRQAARKRLRKKMIEGQAISPPNSHLYE